MKLITIKWILIALLITSLFWCLFITYQYPYIGIRLEPNNHNEWIVNQLETNSSSTSLDIKAGDRILLVDGQHPDIVVSIQKWRIIEQAEQIILSRNGSIFTINIEDRRHTNHDLLQLFSGLFCMLMALVLFVKLRISKSAQLLSLVFLAGGSIYISMGASIRGDELGKILITSFMSVLPVILYHFLVVFLEEKGNIILPRKVLKYLYGVVIVGALTKTLYFTPTLAYMVYNYSGTIILLFFSLGFIINLVILMILYFKHRKDQTYFSTVLRTVWLSLMISFLPVIFLSFIPDLITGESLIIPEYTSAFAIVFPLSFAYLIATDQIYDIGIVLRRFTFALLLSIIPCSLFTITYTLIYLNNVEIGQMIFLFLSSSILVSIILYSMEYLTMQFEGFMFPRRFILKAALKKISKNLESISSYREFEDVILGDIIETLEVKGGAIVFRQGHNMEIISKGIIDNTEIEPLIINPNEHHPMHTCIEINHHEDYTSYLILTRKKTNTRLGREEIQWLKLITTYLAVSLDNLHLIRKLRLSLQQMASQLPNEHEAQDIQWFRKLMFELQEEERMRIAMDLHDTTMQDLFFLKQRFANVIDKYILSQDDRQQMDSMVNFIELINTSLRQSCFELNPYLLKETGLIHTVQKLIDKEVYHSPFTISFHIDPAAKRIEQKDLEFKKHIFRIIQELINNAKKHSQASVVNISMLAPNNIFTLVYEDNGVGFENETAATREIGGSGIGMEQMRGRILYLNGQLELITTIGGGVKYKISIP